MELGEWLSRGFQLTWRYKSLWLFGFLAAFGAGGSPGFSGRLPLERRTALPPVAPGFGEAVRRWLEQNWPLLALALLGLFLSALLIQAVALWGQGALILGGNEAAEGRPPRLGPLARRATARWLRMIGIMVLLGAPGFLVTLLFILAIALGFLFAFARGAEAARLAGLLLAVLAMLALLGCLLLLGAVLHLWSRLALRAALLEDLPWLSALRRGWQVGWRRIGPLLLTWLVLDIGVLGITAFILSFLAAVPLLAMIFAAVMAPAERGGLMEPIALLGLAVLILSLVLCLNVLTRLLMAPVLTFVETTWTLAYRSWIGWTAHPSS